MIDISYDYIKLKVDIYEINSKFGIPQFYYCSIRNPDMSAKQILQIETYLPISMTMGTRVGYLQVQLIDKIKIIIIKKEKYPCTKIFRYGRTPLFSHA